MYRNKKDRQTIAQVLSYDFKNEKLLLQALTRRSGLNEGRQESHIGDFQRLEFIGDKVLNLVVSDILLENHPTWSEGELTEKISEFVNNKGPLAKMAEKLKWGDYLIVGAGEEKARTNKKVLSDAFEALIGALWLDSDKDFKFVRKFLLNQLKVLGLSDFNEDYSRAVIRMGARRIADDLMESILPEIYEGEGGREMSITDFLRFKKAKERATKPLTGLAAAFEHFMLSSDTEEDEGSERIDPTGLEEDDYEGLLTVDPDDYFDSDSPTKPLTGSVPELKAPGRQGYFGATADSKSSTAAQSSSSSEQTTTSATEDLSISSTVSKTEFTTPGYL